jgi:hypothetical protein
MNQAQTLALAKVIGCLEGIVEAGLFNSSDAELEVRIIIAEALSAFDLPGRHELNNTPRLPQ